MNTLTCEELRHYPGRTFTEQLQAHHEELATRPKRLALVGTFPNGAARSKPIHGALPIGRRIDIRRFTGRDRIERVANYLRASVPRAESWSEEALRELATGLLAKAEIVE
jgi:hypothetical protein